MRVKDVYNSKFYPWYRNQIYKLLVLEVLPIENLLNNNSNTVFDVGGNVGLWSIALMEAFSEKIKSLHIFEPSPYSKNRLEQLRNDGFFGDSLSEIFINEYAVGDKIGKDKLYFDKECSELATLTGGMTHLPFKIVQLDKKISVKITTIDDYCSQNLIDFIDYLKIDTEGFEMKVLHGAKRMIAERRIKNIAFEFGLNQIRTKDFFKDFWEFLHTRGYKLSFLRRGEGGFGLLEIPQYHTKWEQFSWNKVFIAQRT